MLGACMIDAVTLTVKDRNGQIIVLALYNQLSQSTKLSKIQKIFPKGVHIGVK